MAIPTHGDGKLYYSISEIAELLRESQTVVRSWESDSGLLNTRKNRKGDRLFTYDDLLKLKTIQHLIRDKGISLKHVKHWVGADKKIKNISKSELIGGLLDLKETLLEVDELLKHKLKHD